MAEGQVTKEVKTASTQKSEVLAKASPTRRLHVVLERARSPLQALRNIADARIRTTKEHAVSSEETVTEKEKLLGELRTIKSFTTAKGSVYTYDDQLRTSRFKAKTGKQFGVQDLTVFGSLTEQEAEEVSAATRSGSTRRVLIVEQQSDSIPKVIKAIGDVTDPGNLRFGFVEGGGLTVGRQVSLLPFVGADVFDTNQSIKEDGKTYIEGHLGHKVTAIHKRDSS